MRDVAGNGGVPNTSLTRLLADVLDRVVATVEGAVGAAVSLGRGGGSARNLAAVGFCETVGSGIFDDLIVDVVESGEPVVTADVFADPRWPALTPEAVHAQWPARRSEWDRVCGVAAVPGVWQDSGELVILAVLDRPAGAAVVDVLTCYQSVVATALAVGTDVEDMWQALRSGAVIEQAKGAIVARRRCDPDEAWETLRRSSQQFNVKVRELAVALVEHLGATSTRPAGGVSPTARRAAELLWAAFDDRVPRR
jgi:hypothetical protein